MNWEESIMEPGQLDSIQRKHEKEHPEMWRVTGGRDTNFTYTHHYVGGRSLQSYTAEAQARISFQMGIQEVVEYLNAKRNGGYNFCVKLSWDEWNAQLKDWGLE